MKFNKQINNGTLLIPGGAFKISGFEGGEKVEIHTLDSAVVVLKKQMTTMELIQAMDALHRLATELTVHLARVCGTCDDCEDGCPFDDLEDGMLELPDYLREEAGIPAGAKLCVYVDDEEKTVTIAEAGYPRHLSPWEKKSRFWPRMERSSSSPQRRNCGSFRWSFAACSMSWASAR